MTLASVVISGATAQVLGLAQVGVVVDVAVEGGHHVGGDGPVPLLGVQGVGVGLGDDPDARPPGMADHGGAGAGRGEGPSEEGVGANGGAQRLDVVAEFADLRRRLVHEAQAAPDRPDRPGLEAGRRRPGLHDGVVRIQLVSIYQDVQAGGVPTPHLEAVDRGQRHLDGPPAVQGGDRACRPA